LTGVESEFSKMHVEKGARRWWCCGRRVRTKVDLDFEMCDNGADRINGERIERRESDGERLWRQGGSA